MEVLWARGFGVSTPASLPASGSDRMHATEACQAKAVRETNMVKPVCALAAIHTLFLSRSGKST
jgi:hypothetical protein